MKTVCFMGSHFGMPLQCQQKAKDIIKYLIKNNYKIFYCGMYGDFDFQINSILFELKKDNPDIVLIFVSPYYESNKFINKKAKQEYQVLKSQILYEYEGFDDIKKRIKDFEKDYQNDFFNKKYIYQKKIFDKTILCELDNVPYKFRIIECNKWKVQNSDILVTFCNNKYSNTYKIRHFALKLNKKVIDIVNNF